jgi:hypothetical protein
MTCSKLLLAGAADIGTGRMHLGTCRPSDP